MVAKSNKPKPQRVPADSPFAAAWPDRQYALRDVQKPIGVAEWETRLMETLPEELQGSLPTVEQLEAELATLEKLSEVEDAE
jgi:hypothetical protein